MAEGNPRLAGQSAIVTGAGRGIGRVLALTLAEEGAGVVVSGRNEQNLNSVADEIRSSGGKALAVRCDVTDWAQVKDLADETVRAYGTIDILVNNAGIPSSAALLVDVEEAEWDAIMETNLKGMFLMTKAVLPGMMDRKSGHVITVSSGAGTSNSRNAMTIAYVVSKWGVEGFRHSMAMQLKDYGIRVNTLAPGPVLNDFQRSRDLKVESYVDRLVNFPGGMRRNEWVRESFQYLISETGDLTGAHVSSPEWDREHNIDREPISEAEIRAFMAG
jgi:3-oxoacyl-[acyl-carrier protein] reductase